VSTYATARRADQAVQELCAEDQVTDFGFTAQDVAELGGVSIHAARASIRRHLNVGTVTQVGRNYTGQRGRPAIVYGSTRATAPAPVLA
jgi:predicted ArsR family transcriptional regulator